MNPHAELSDARAELIAVAVEWHGGKLPDQRLHDAAERYQTLRDAYLDSLWSPDVIRGPPVNRCAPAQTIYPKGEAMRKTLITLGLVAGGLFAAAGVAAADQTVIVNESNSSTSTSADCLPAEVAAQFPWLPVPVCP